MVELTEQLRRLGDAAEAHVDRVDVDELGAGGIRTPTSGRRGGRQGRVLAAAAVVAAVLIGAAALLAGTRSSERVTTDEPTPTSIESLGSGWHDLDPGPLGPRFRAGVLGVGDEVVVLGGIADESAPLEARDGAAFDPRTATWRSIAAVPLDTWAAPSAWHQLVATDDGILALVGAPGRERAAALWNAERDTWETVAPAPPARDQHLGDPVWLGDGRVLVPDAQVLFDPGAGGWVPIAPPPPEASGRRWLSTWTGEAVVLAGFGAPALAWDPDLDAWRLLGDAPAARLGGLFAELVWTGSEAVLVDAGGGAAALDPVAGTWRSLPRVPFPMGGCRQPVATALDGIVLVDGCWGVAALVEDRWIVIENRDAPRFPSAVALGGVLYQWESRGRSMLEGGPAPATSFRAWVPPGDWGDLSGSLGCTPNPWDDPDEAPATRPGPRIPAGLPDEFVHRSSGRTALVAVGDTTSDVYVRGDPDDPEATISVVVLRGDLPPPASWTGWEEGVPVPAGRPPTLGLQRGGTIAWEVAPGVIGQVATEGVDAETAALVALTVDVELFLERECPS